MIRPTLKSILLAFYHATGYNYNEDNYHLFNMDDLDKEDIRGFCDTICIEHNILYAFNIKDFKKCTDMHEIIEFVNTKIREMEEDPKKFKKLSESNKFEGDEAFNIDEYNPDQQTEFGLKDK